MKTPSRHRSFRFRVFPRCLSSRMESLLTGWLARNQNQPSPRDCSRTYLKRGKTTKERIRGIGKAKTLLVSLHLSPSLFPCSAVPLLISPALFEVSAGKDLCRV